MDGTSTWQNKCGGATWQSSMASPSSHVPPQEHRTQLERSMGYFNNSLTAQNLRSVSNGRVLEPIFLNNLNIGSYKSDDVELRNSFLGIFSGPSSLLQCDNQQAITTSAKLATYGNVIINAAGRVVVPQPNVPLSDNLGNGNERNCGYTPSFATSWPVGIDNQRNSSKISPVFPTRAFFPSDYGRATIPCNDFHGSNLNLQSSDLDKAVDHCIVPGTEKGKNFSSLRNGQHAGVDVANSVVLPCTSFLHSEKISLDTSATISNQSTTFVSGCPRVYCVGKSGDLLLSNTGLLGILCSCHSLHMSVSKFCEHSGLHGVNPGDAIRMDNGVTIAHWRKLYLQKFGIRAPEDQNGWDWPQWSSVTAGFAKSGFAISKMFNSDDFSHEVSSLKGLAMSGNPWDNALFPMRAFTTRNPLIDTLKKVQYRDNPDELNLLPEGLTVTSNPNLHAMPDSQLMECTVSRYMTMSKFVGRKEPENSLQSSAYSDSLSKCGPSFICQPTLQNLKNPDQSSNARNSNNSIGGLILNGDIVSSNIELKLGQPYQQSPTLGNPLQSAIGHQILGKLGSAPELISPAHLIPNRENVRVLESCRNPQYAASTSNSKEKSEKIESNIMNYAFQINNAVDAAQLSSAAMIAANGPPKGNGNFQANNFMDGGIVCSARKTQHCDLQVIKSPPISSRWNPDARSERHSVINQVSRHGPEHNGVPDCSFVATKPGYGCHNSLSLNGAQGENNNLIGFPVHDRSFYSSQLTGVSLNASEANNCLNYSGKVPCPRSSVPINDPSPRPTNLTMNYLNYSGKVPCPRSSGPINDPSPRPTNSTMASCSGVNFTPREVSMGFVSANQTMPNWTPTLSSKETFGVNPCLMNENTRMLAAGHMPEPSVQQHAIASLRVNPELKRFSSFSHVQNQLIDTSTSKQQSHVVNITNKNDVSQASLKSLKYDVRHSIADIKKSTSVAGSTNTCNFSPSSEEHPLYSKDIDMPHQFSHDPFSIKPSSLRLAASTSSVISSNENDSVQRALSNCCCPHENCCLARDCERRVETSLGALEKQIDGVGHKASVALAENVEDRDAPIEKALSLEQKKSPNGQTCKNFNFNAFQWKDVPNKGTKVCGLTSIERTPDGLNERGTHGNHNADSVPVKCSIKGVQAANTLENNVSNDSSGCSAPEITQASIEVNNTGSCTIDARDSGYRNDGLIDEGSVIDKCWSSNTDDTEYSDRSEGFLGSSCKSNSLKERSSKELTNQSSCDLMGELKLMDSSRWNNAQNQALTGLTFHEKTSHPQTDERSLKVRKRKRAKWKILDASVPGTGLISVSSKSRKFVKHSKTTKETPLLLLPDQGTSHPCGAGPMGPKFKRGRSSLYPAKAVCHKRNMKRVHREEEDICDTNHADLLKEPHMSCCKRIKHDSFADTSKQLRTQESDYCDSAADKKFKAANSIKTSSSRMTNICNRNAKPTVFGKYGLISNEKFLLDVSRPAKIVSLSKILKNAKRCALPVDNKSMLNCTKVLKKTLKGNQCFARFINLKEKDHENYNAISHKELDPANSMEDKDKLCFNGDKEHKQSMFENETHVGSLKIQDTSNCDGSNGLNCKSKELCELSPRELIAKEEDYFLMNSSVKKSSEVKQKKNCSSMGKLFESNDEGKSLNNEPHNISAKKSSKENQKRYIASSLDAFCCVCGSSKQDQINCLVECGRCYIRVHQACYGVAKVPKGRWFCRPCRTTSVNMICVLCGYGGGAMTRALRSHGNMKSLLGAWDIVIDCKPNDMMSSTTLLQKSMPRQSADVKISSGFLSNLKVHNSVTAGVLDSTVKQWVHMVCGLWTPGTRCPNVDTMGAFDVSGASRPKASVVCSLCNRPGGSCIQCRVVNCSVQFHPWCAHQKGLLQSEIEGVENGSVGFYGRCVLHAMHSLRESDGESIVTETCPGNEGFTCARTEGYKGRKQDGLWHSFCKPYGNGKGFVPQEQLNAWLHINGQKPNIKGLPQSISDVDHDCRKEYARYKHTKSWKHLVVYKSGIHALGLYTSRFICRGAMVVEYVGEIVGLRVSDKRENEYQSSKRLQYKGACYFFKIDKEHIIDATRKGGIARFVNHSCLPNCVAKVISVRNEKKVVFFAERDIFPGEEITYDYHFNNEDEGKKIPCFCNSKNCRRYLN